MIDREIVETKLAKTEELIKDYELMMAMAATFDDSEFVKKVIDRRIELAGIKGQLEYILTLC